jgi:hypothetical protein
MASDKPGNEPRAQPVLIGGEVSRDETSSPARGVTHPPARDATRAPGVR